MRWTQTLIPTLKETPADAEITSHKLLLRAGLIRKLTGGLYTFMPMGLRVLRKVEQHLGLFGLGDPCRAVDDEGRGDVRLVLDDQDPLGHALIVRSAEDDGTPAAVEDRGAVDGVAARPLQLQSAAAADAEPKKHA